MSLGTCTSLLNLHVMAKWATNTYMYVNRSFLCRSGSDSDLLHHSKLKAREDFSVLYVWNMESPKLPDNKLRTCQSLCYSEQHTFCALVTLVKQFCHSISLNILNTCAYVRTSSSVSSIWSSHCNRTSPLIISCVNFSLCCWSPIIFKRLMTYMHKKQSYNSYKHNIGIGQY